MDALALPERPIDILHTSIARTRIGFDIFYYPDHRVVPETDYLRRKRPTAWPAELSAEQPHVGDMPIMVIYNPGWTNYFHRLTQGYFSAWLFRTFHSEGPCRYLHPQVNDAALAPLRHLGIDRDQLILADVGQTFELNNLRFLPTSYGSYAFAPSPLLADYGAAIRSTVPPRSGNRRRIYISRRDTSYRRMVNEDKLEALLTAKRYEIVTLSDMTFADQVNLFRACDEIVAPHGAGLSNLIFCQKGTKVLELTSHAYVNPCFARIAQVLGLDFTMHISGITKKASLQTEIEWEADLETLLPLT